MATGIYTDMKVYQEQFQGGFVETVVQNIEAFNAASRGAIVLETDVHKGQFLQEAMTLLGSTMSHRVLSSVSSIADSTLSQDEYISPKIAWRDGPVAHTRESWLQIAEDPQMLARTLGIQAAGKLNQLMLNSACAALKGLFMVSSAAFTSAVYDSSGLSAAAEHVSFTNLTRAKAKFGDAGQRIVCWVMHSSSYYRLMEAAISTLVDSVAGVTISTGGTPTLGLPVVMTDSSYLYVDANSAANDKAYVYGLVPGAIRIKISAQTQSVFDTITGLANLVDRYQAEGSYTIRARGAKWNTTYPNPTDAQLATDYWTQVATSIKDGPGVGLICQGTVSAK